MKFLVISDAHLIEQGGKKVAYAPYVKEMDLWMPLVDQTIFVCPKRIDGDLLAQPFIIQDFEQVGLRRLEFHTPLYAIISFITLPYQALVLWNQMRKADHIHLRCPGNLALLACFVQILFPWKKKTGKYAGNWNPSSKQPFSYKIQKWLLSNTFLTRNMKVLVYGEWEGMTKNIKPFFTATYYAKEARESIKRDFQPPLRAIFVGTMSENKRPYETVQLVERLNDMGLKISLDMYGEGNEIARIKRYILTHNLEHLVRIHGNQPEDIIKEAYFKSDILILLSKSEGWPKVVAEAMYWGVIPIATSISSVPWMLGYGERGVIINNIDFIKMNWISSILDDTIKLSEMSKKAQKWSRQYTLDAFQEKIKKIL
ncbi:glycosyltransferase [Dokdonia sp. Hel_I_53]|uniref:glycosyltransferase n=1 Tax=Dokdonia sp. Hel_I_53 TaxID=1566287 RepID=UPI00119987E1|nr:glycosyltransferase [Dokdonia sp. Hel_I_53]TVZ53402.1 glycosyltransferase involved in cell wall biosynthesis [Dokdonia sp. Hel_I_53]